MARRNSTSSSPQPAKLSIDDKRRAIVLLRRRLEDLSKFDPDKIQDRNDPAINKISQAIQKTLTDIFGADTVEASRYRGAAYLDHARMSVLGDVSRHEVIDGLKSGKSESISTIEGIIEGFEEDIELAGETAARVSTALKEEVSEAPSRKIFVVHGHDEAARQSVCRYLERLNLVPVVLHEQTNQGDTIIEKLERNSDVGFAVVLMTPDDIGGQKGLDFSEFKPRARQNVVFELGYFIAKLGRGRVCTLLKGDIEVLSDFSGVVYTPMDPSDAWQIKIAKEIKGAGIPIDTSRLLD